jgi:hypothetical protein
MAPRLYLSRKIKRIFQTSVIESQNLRPKFIAPLTPQITTLCHPESAFGWDPNNENDPDAQAREEKQRLRRDHDL